VGHREGPEPVGLLGVRRLGGGRRCAGGPDEARGDDEQELGCRDPLYCFKIKHGENNNIMAKKSEAAGNPS